MRKPQEEENKKQPVQGFSGTSGAGPGPSSSRSSKCAKVLDVPDEKEEPQEPEQEGKWKTVHSDNVAACTNLQRQCTTYLSTLKMAVQKLQHSTAMKGVSPQLREAYTQELIDAKGDLEAALQTFEGTIGPQLVANDKREAIKAATHLKALYSTLENAKTDATSKASDILKKLDK